jgi:hypothetical protein
MNTHLTPSAPVPPVASPASVRLAQNRARLADWLEHDRAAQANPSLGGWAARSLLPLIDGLRQHPTASLALGALAQAWLRPSPAGGGVQHLQTQALAAAVNTVRKHPKTTVAVVALAGAAWWWSRSRPHPPP